MANSIDITNKICYNVYIKNKIQIKFVTGGKIMKKRLQGLIAGMIIGATVTGVVGVLAASYTATENVFPIKLNGNDVNIEGYNIDGSTYFKLRDIGENIGFNVEFQNNTIYIGDIPSSESNESNQTNVDNTVKYYAEKSWCPDFGAYVGAEPTDVSVSENKVTYTYDLANFTTKYYDLILDKTNLKLNPASMGNFVVFENLKTNQAVVCILKDTEFKVVVEN